MNIRLSWLIPVRDAYPMILEAIDSVASELGPRDEIVLVDDGSKIRLERSMFRAASVHLIRQEPMGIVAALERGRAEAKGEFIARMDSDDLVLPGRIEAQLEFLNSSPTYGVVGGQAQIFRDGSPVPGGMKRYVDWANGVENIDSALLIESPLFHPATTIRAAVLSEVGGYREGPFPEDYELWLRIRRAGWRLHNLPRPVLQIRDRVERLTRTDSRYSRKAFMKCKMEHLSLTRLSTPCRVAVWGVGKAGKPWIRWLLETGHQVIALVDSFVRTERRGIVVQAPEALENIDPDLLIVAVGARGARKDIRACIHRLRPEWVEGQDWMAVA
jgi:glycosyltransferase involved in cell wall biosynthesis